MKSAIVVIGISEIGSVIARGVLKIGHPVYPITRAMDIKSEASTLSEPVLVVLAVSEAELDSLLTKNPEQWRSKLVLIQGAIFLDAGIPHVMMKKYL